jgi:hypothetical protein
MFEDKFIVEYIAWYSLEYLAKFTFLLSFTLREIKRSIWQILHFCCLLRYGRPKGLFVKFYISVVFYVTGDQKEYLANFTFLLSFTLRETKRSICQILHFCYLLRYGRSKGVFGKFYISVVFYVTGDQKDYLSNFTFPLSFTLRETKRSICQILHFCCLLRYERSKRVFGRFYISVVFYVTGDQKKTSFFSFDFSWDVRSIKYNSVSHIS